MSARKIGCGCTENDCAAAIPTAGTATAASRKLLRLNDAVVKDVLLRSIRLQTLSVNCLGRPLSERLSYTATRFGSVRSLIEKWPTGGRLPHVCRGFDRSAPAGSEPGRFPGPPLRPSHNKPGPHRSCHGWRPVCRAQENCQPIQAPQLPHARETLLRLQVSPASCSNRRAGEAWLHRGD